MWQWRQSHKKLKFQKNLLLLFIIYVLAHLVEFSCRYNIYYKNNVLNNYFKAFIIIFWFTLYKLEVCWLFKLIIKITLVRRFFHFTNKIGESNWQKRWDCNHSITSLIVKSLPLLCFSCLLHETRSTFIICSYFRFLKSLSCKIKLKYLTDFKSLPALLYDKPPNPVNLIRCLVSVIVMKISKTLLLWRNNTEIFQPVYSDPEIMLCNF